MHAGGTIVCSYYPGSEPAEPVRGLADATAISVGGTEHACAITTGGGVACWGNNTYGTLGDGTTEMSETPVAVSGITDAIAVAAGWFHTCALIAGGGVMCWGLNDDGELGNGEKLTVHNVSTPHSLHLVPVAVSGLDDATAIAAGGSYTCALRSVGSAVCWGSGLRLGAGGLDPSSIPVPVAGIADATAITADDSHTCALLGDQTVQCWGDNHAGQLGIVPDHGALSQSLIPVSVPDFSDVTALAAGFDYTCAIRAGGEVACWGGNSVGQLGDETLSDTWTPVPVSGITDAQAIDAGFQYTCVLRAAGSVTCWGWGQPPAEITL
jgi:alpha-tubulin suppressor-like RCC1 family protein